MSNSYIDDEDDDYYYDEYDNDPIPSSIKGGGNRKGKGISKEKPSGKCNDSCYTSKHVRASIERLGLHNNTINNNNDNKNKKTNKKNNKKNNK